MDITIQVCCYESKAIALLFMCAFLLVFVNVFTSYRSVFSGFDASREFDDKGYYMPADGLEFQYPVSISLLRVSLVDLACF